MNGLINKIDMLFQIIKHTHSGLRWFVLLFLILSIIIAAYKLLVKSDYSKLDKALSIANLSIIHIQLIIGLILYFISPKVIFKAESMSNSLLRYFLVEHAALMLLAIATITIGYTFIKKATDSNRKNLNTVIFYSAGLLLILISIPWPWKSLQSGWF